MSWIVNQQSSQEELAGRFRKLMSAPDILQIPGAHDGWQRCSRRRPVFLPYICLVRLIQPAGDFLI